MFFDERPMEDEQMDQQEVWSAIRYLDPDERDQDREQKTAILAVLALLLTVCAVWVVLWLRVRGLCFGESDAESDFSCVRLRAALEMLKS